MSRKILLSLVLSVLSVFVAWKDIYLSFLSKKSIPTTKYIRPPYQIARILLVGYQMKRKNGKETKWTTVMLCEDVYSIYSTLHWLSVEKMDGWKWVRMNSQFITLSGDRHFFSSFPHNVNLFDWHFFFSFSLFLPITFLSYWFIFYA